MSDRDVAPDPAPTTADEVGLPDLEDARTVLLLALADDELVTGHRASHWTGVAPSIEEDLAFSTIAQDEINHADVWYQLAVAHDRPDAPADEVRAAVDRLGLGRQPNAYRHAILCERPPRDFAYTLARQWAYDLADDVRLEALAGSSDADIAAVARKLRHEERYHLEHADHWFRRIASGSDEGRERLHGGLAAVIPEALGLFEPLPGEDVLVADRVLPLYSAQLLARWLEAVVPMLDEVGAGALVDDDLRPTTDGWELPEGRFAEPGGRYGHHTADFTDDVWPEMTALHRAHPGVSW